MIQQSLGYTVHLCRLQNKAQQKCTGSVSVQITEHGGRIGVRTAGASHVSSTRRLYDKTFVRIHAGLGTSGGFSREGDTYARQRDSQ